MDRTQALHHVIEASRLAFAATRACLIDPAKAGTSPVAPGDPTGKSGGCKPGQGTATPSNEQHTNHFVVTDR